MKELGEPIEADAKEQLGPRRGLGTRFILCRATRRPRSSPSLLGGLAYPPTRG